MNKEEYFSLETHQQWWSVSQYKDFRSCQSLALARMKGEHQPKSKDAFLFGSYVHAWSEGVLEEFKAENPQMYLTTGKNKGQLKAEFKTADKMIQALESDSWCVKFLEGEKEVIMTGSLFGCNWKIMIDVLNLEKGFFSDLKTTQGIFKNYGGGKTFIEQYSYIEQMAVYREIIKQNTGKELVPYIVAIEKADIPNKAIIKVTKDLMEDKLQEIEFYMEELKKVKSGDIKPTSCGICDYCKATKKVNKIMSIEELKELV